MLGRRFGNDTVTEIEDERQARHRRANVVDPVIEGRTPAHQQQRIEVALRDRAAFRNSLHDAEGAGRIAADAIDAGRRDVAIKVRCRATRKSDDRYTGVAFANLTNQFCCRSDNPALELVIGQTSGPAVENLQRIGAG